MFETNEQDVLSKLERWGTQNDNVRAMILTSSRVSKSSKPDKLSDYDVELIVKDLHLFNSDDWLDYFGFYIIFIYNYLVSVIIVCAIKVLIINNLKVNPRKVFKNNQPGKTTRSKASISWHEWPLY